MSEYPDPEHLLKAVFVAADLAVKRASVAHPEDVLSQVCGVVDGIEDFISALSSVGLHIKDRP